MSRRRSMNTDLSELPRDDEVLAAVDHLVENDRRHRYGASANAIAGKLGVQGARRLGNGAMKGSWSGTMSASLRISPRLRALVKRGLLDTHYNNEDYRNEYTLTEAGRARLAGGAT